MPYCCIFGINIDDDSIFTYYAVNLNILDLSFKLNSYFHPCLNNNPNENHSLKTQSTYRSNEFIVKCGLCAISKCIMCVCDGNAFNHPVCFLSKGCLV